MAIKASGSLALSEIAAEFGDSQPHSMSEFIRGGSLVPQADANNNIPTSTSNMSFDDFYGAVNVIAVTASSGTDVSAASLFGDNWTVDVPKELIIPSGVTLGATSTSAAALTIENTLVGTLTVKNSGSVQGAGGAAGTGGAGGAGGDAVDVNATCTIINESGGELYAGGGGGGLGGTGGQGSYSSTQNLGFATSCPPPCNYTACNPCCNNTYGGGAYCASPVYDGDGCCSYCNNCRRNVTSYSSGGAGGAGGVGQGYSQSAGSGSSGSAGGTNAGAGGTGGNGGSWGTAGSTGATGANGNYTNGSAGSAGGAAGNYINGIASVTFTNNGSVAGNTA